MAGYIGWVVHCLLLSCPLCGADSSGGHGVPKIIWSFWSNQSSLPKLVQLAQASWRFFAPDYEIRFLDSSAWSGFLTGVTLHGLWPGENVTPESPDPRFSDWLRVALLARHGGIWMDASILLAAPLERLINQSAQVSGVHLDGLLFEPWFIAAAKGSSTMQRWRDEFQRICSMNMTRDYEGYLLELKFRGVEPLNGHYKGCWWRESSPAHAVAHWIFQKAVRLVNMFTALSRFYLHPCGELWWMRYLRLPVALNSVIGTDGSDPQPLWDRNGISVLDSKATLSAVSFLHGFDNERTARFLMTHESEDFNLSLACGLKLRAGERRAMEARPVCEEGSVICRIEKSIGFQVFQHTSPGDAGWGLQEL